MAKKPSKMHTCSVMPIPHNPKWCAPAETTNMEEVATREVRFTVTDWSGTWFDMEIALDRFAADNEITIKNLEMTP